VVKVPKEIIHQEHRKAGFNESTGVEKVFFFFQDEKLFQVDFFPMPPHRASS